MSLSVAGVWQVDVWDQTVWADGVWREGSPAAVAELNRALGDIMLERLEINLSSTGSVNDLFYWYLEIQTSSVGTTNDLHYKWLGSLGYTSQTLQGRVIERLVALGYSGDIDDMYYDAWNNGDYI